MKKQQKKQQKTRRKAGTRAGAAPARQSSAKGSPPIVGIGASAGGLEAFTLLLEHLPVDTGMAFVLVQHLEPDHESALPEILARTTAMPVREVTDKVVVRPNCVYVIPPDKRLSVARGLLRLEPRGPVAGAARAIDSFLESLAREQQGRAIGVILSGTASDGTMGLEAIKAEGGITFAQDESAAYDSMPRSAVAAGCVDYVLSPEGIAGELARIAGHPYVAGRGLSPTGEVRAKGRSSKAALGDGDGEGAGARHGETGRGDEVSGLRRILLLLRNQGGVDFSLYKPSTMQRRIARRMVLNKCETLEGYGKFLRGNQKEQEALCEDLLISVTNFFRNPEAFEGLKREVFPKLFQHRRSNEPVRVWVAGCSTGQEVYSIAMAYQEFSEARAFAPELKLFATDLNEGLLEKARQGFYPRSLAEELSPERLRRFFVEEEGGYRASKGLRERCIFARQNLLSDPPFSRMDLISCRNVLIYIEAGPQRKILSMLHYALKPNGFLLLGASESVGAASELFKTVDRKLKLFCREPGVTPRLPLPVFRNRREGAKPGALAGKAPAGPSGELNAMREADRIVANRFAPPGVLIDAELRIVQARGATGDYLGLATGKTSLEVLKMARGDLMLPLRAAINKARKQGKAARTERVSLRHDAEGREVNLEVIPLRNLKERYYLILFEEAAGGRSVERERVEREAAKSPTRSEAPRLARLEGELRETREYLQSVQEQYEAANEELQASNEEMTSSNEELQSMNEELETSKEELESSNEELMTVSEEIANRNRELSRLNSDLNNLQLSIDTPILVLARDLRIRRFTPPAEKVFSLLANDVGRPLSDIRHKLDFSGLEAFIEEAVSSISVREREVQDTAGNWYVLRVRPYVTVDHQIDGAVLLLVDVNVLKQTEQKIREARDFAEAVIESVPPLVILEPDLRVRSANQAFYATFGAMAAQTQGRLIYELGNGQWNIPALRKLLEEILPQAKAFKQYEVTHEFKDIGRRTMLISGRQVESLRAIVLSIEDITERKRAEEALSESERQFRTLADSMPQLAWWANSDGYITWYNQRWYEYTGTTPEQMAGWGWQSVHDPELLPEVLEKWKGSIATGEPYEMEFPLRGADGQFRWFLTRGMPVKDAQGKVARWFGTNTDVSEQRKVREVLARGKEELERLVAERTARLDRTVNELEHFSHTITHDLRAPLRAMQGFAGSMDRLCGESLGSEAKEYLGLIKGSAVRMDRLITDALQYSKAGQQPLTVKSVDAGRLMRGIIESYPNLQPPKARIQVRGKIPPVTGNEAGLTQCFSNLLDNAVKFVAPGTVPEVVIWAELRGQEREEKQRESETDATPTSDRQPTPAAAPAVVRIWIEDNGIGIPKEAQGQLFQVFQRASTAFEGTGVGLALVKRVAQQMGGSVGFESEEGQGSRFWLELKAAS
jgi:two-component system CheB/CheR fusion protein